MRIGVLRRHSDVFVAMVGKSLMDAEVVATMIGKFPMDAEVVVAMIGKSSILMVQTRKCPASVGETQHWMCTKL